MDVSSAQASTYSGLPSLFFRTLFVSRSITNFPVLSMMPALNISATTSIMAEPQIPFALILPSIWVCQSALPITLYFGSFVTGSIFTFSIAPGAALIPNLICAPSNAGPVAHDVEHTLSLLPRRSSPFVPMSIMSTISSWKYCSWAIRTPTLSAPTKPASIGSTWMKAPGLILSPGHAP